MVVAVMMVTDGGGCNDDSDRWCLGKLDSCILILERAECALGIAIGLG